MRILYPTLSKIDLNQQGIYSDLINALTEAGHTVTVVQVCGPKETRETSLIQSGNVRFLKVLVGELFGVGFLKKGIRTLRITPRLIAAMKKYLSGETFDLVIYATPPITFSGVVKFAKKKYGCRSFLMLKDIFPQNAVDLELFSRRSPIYAYFRRQEKRLYALSDTIGCMSEGNRRYLLEHEPNMDARKIIIFPNTQKITPLVSCENTRGEDEPLRFVFGGNFGKPQAIDFLLRTIGSKRMRMLPAEFVMIGNGSEQEKVKEAAKKLPNLTFHAFLPPKEYEVMMRGCDVGLISLDARFTIPNYPSRTLSYMAGAKPILACTDRTTDLKNLIETEAACGRWCPSDDADAFCDCVEEMIGNRAELAQYGENGRRYLERHFDVTRSVALIEKANQ